MSTPRFSLILATYGRRDVVRRVLDELQRLELSRGDYEIIVVDNGSDDGTPDVVAQSPGVRLIPLEENHGSCAKSFGVAAARGEYLVFLDDDSYPRRGALSALARHFDERPTLGAAGFTIHLPDGAQECSALPHVFVGCGVGLRAEALQEAGGLDATFFMQAEEYDLSLRLLQAGWDVEVLADLQVEHLKTPRARRSERTTYYDVRNNLRVVGRYLPDHYVEIYEADWLQRYGWLAEQAGHGDAFERGQRDGRKLAARERRRYRRWRLTRPVLERVFCWRGLERRMTELHADGARRIALIDLGKNAYAFLRGAKHAGIEVVGLASDALAREGRTYRGVPVVTLEAALGMDVDAHVIANTSYVHAAQREAELVARTPCPVRNWFPPPQMSDNQQLSIVDPAWR